MKFLLHWLIHTLALLLVAEIVPGITVANWLAALAAALVLGVFNVFLRPLLIFFTFPLMIVSFGIFTFFINAFLFYIASEIVKGFAITGFWSAFWGALLFSVISFMLNVLTRAPSGSGIFFYGRTPRPEARSRRNVIDAEIVPDDEERKRQKK